MEVSIGTTSILLELTTIDLAMLAALIGLTTAAFFYMKKLRKERTVKLGNYETLTQVHGRKTVASPSVLTVKILTVTLLFLVATGSIQIMSTQPVTDTDFVIAMDNSQSMMTPDYPPNRLEFAKGTTQQFVDSLPGNTEISIITLGGGATPVSTPSRNPGDVETAIQEIEADPSTTGKAIGDSIELGANILTESEQENQKILVITDGDNTVGTNLSTAIDQAEQQNVQVEIMGITSTSQTDQIYANLTQTLQDAGFNAEVTPPSIDSDHMQNQAQRTGGEYHEISSEQFLENTLEEMALEDETVPLDSNFYILIFLSLLIISEMLLYSKYGAI